MKDPKIKRYMKKLSYSYAFGTYPTIDLLKYKPEKVIKIYLKDESFGSAGVDEIIELCEKNGINYEVNNRVIEKLSLKENTYSLAVFEKYECEISKGSNHVVLDKPRNMGNIGTIIRTMVGFGFKDLVIISPGADIFDPMIVRSAMGALFTINFRYYSSIQEYTESFPTHNRYLFMLNGAKSIETVKYKPPYSLIFGNESTGLPDEYAKLGESVYIEHEKDIDSLNLSIAVGIGLYRANLISK